MSSFQPKYRSILTISQAAEVLNVSDRFMRRLVSERRIAFIKVGRFVRFDRATLDAYLERHTIEEVR